MCGSILFSRVFTGFVLQVEDQLKQRNSVSNIDISLGKFFLSCVLVFLVIFWYLYPSSSYST